MKQLFCLTYAGGNAAFFQQFSEYLPKEIECIALEYAGHGIRRTEPLYTTFDEMVTDTTVQINEKLVPDGSYGIFGYSMGSLVAYEAAVRGQLLRAPDCLFTAAHYAPSISSVEETFSDLSDDLLVKRLKAFGGLHTAFAANKRFWPMFLPAIRNDYRLLEMYGFGEKKLMMEQDLTVFYSEEDTSLPFIEPWKNITNGKTVFYRMPGKHFFLREHGSEIAKIISEKLGEGSRG